MINNLIVYFQNINKSSGDINNGQDDKKHLLIYVLCFICFIMCIWCLYKNQQKRISLQNELVDTDLYGKVYVKQEKNNFTIIKHKTKYFLDSNIPISWIRPNRNNIKSMQLALKCNELQKLYKIEQAKKSLEQLCESIQKEKKKYQKGQYIPWMLKENKYTIIWKLEYTDNSGNKCEVDNNITVPNPLKIKENDPENIEISVEKYIISKVFDKHVNRVRELLTVYDLSSQYNNLQQIIQPFEGNIYGLFELIQEHLEPNVFKNKMEEYVKKRKEYIMLDDKNSEQEGLINKHNIFDNRIRLVKDNQTKTCTIIYKEHNPPALIDNC